MYFLLSCLIFTLLAKSADNKLKIFFLFFTGNKDWHYIQTVSSGDNFDEMSSLIFPLEIILMNCKSYFLGKYKESINNCLLLYVKGFMFLKSRHS